MLTLLIFFYILVEHLVYFVQKIGKSWENISKYEKYFNHRSPADLGNKFQYLEKNPKMLQHLKKKADKLEGIVIDENHILDRAHLNKIKWDSEEVRYVFHLS